MPNWNPFKSSKTPEETHNWLIRSTTRAIGKRLLTEPSLNPRRRELIEEELSLRIGLMRHIPHCDPHAIFHYNSKGFKSFTSEYREILQRDLSNRHPYDRTPGSGFLDYDRSMLEREGEEAGMVNRALGEVRRIQEADDRLEERNERRLRDREKQEKERNAREREEAHAREMWARDERERKARKQEDEQLVQEIDNRAREKREKEARDHQRSRGSRQGPPGPRRRDSVAENQLGRPRNFEARPPRGSHRDTYDDETDEYEPDHRGPIPKGPPDGQKPGRPSMHQRNHIRQRPSQAQGSNHPPRPYQRKTATMQTKLKAQDGGKEPGTQKKQASRPPKQPATPAKPPPRQDWSPPSPQPDQRRDEAGAPLEWDDRSAWVAVGNPEYWSEALGEL